MTDPIHPTPRQLLRRLDTAAFPKTLGLNDLRAPLHVAAHAPRSHAQPNVKKFCWGQDGFARSLALTGATAAASAVVFPALALGATLPACQTLAATTTAATALSYIGTLIGLWSAQDMGHGHLATSTSLRIVPAITTGIGLGVLWGAHAACTVAGVAAGGAALAVLGYLTMVRQGICDVTLTATVACFAAALVVGPMGWLILGGMAAPCALSVSVCLASSSTIIAAFALAALRTVQQAPPTHLLDKLEVESSVVAAARLEGVSSGTLPPTIFNVPEELASLATRLKALMTKEGPIFTGFNGLCVTTLYGPPGSGKTFSAAGLAQALDGLYVMCDEAALSINNVKALPEQYMNLVTLIMEAELKGARHNRPVVLLIDEVDALLPRTDGVDATKAFNDVAGFVLLANVLSLLASGKTHLIMVMTTNHPEKIAPLLRRISHREPIYLSAPGRVEMAKIMCGALAKLTSGLDLRRVPHGKIDSYAEVEGFVERLAEMKVTGRALNKIQERAMWHAIRAYRHADASLTEDECSALVDTQALNAFDKGLRELERNHRTTTASHAGQMMYERLEADRSDAAVEQLMADMGFKDLDPFEITRRLSEQFLGTYVDPSQSVGLSMLASRFYMTIAQLALLYASQRVAAPQAQDITDVSPSAGRTFFAGGDLRGEMIQLMKKTWRDAFRKPQQRTA